MDQGLDISGYFKELGIRIMDSIWIDRINAGYMIGWIMNGKSYDILEINEEVFGIMYKKGFWIITKMYRTHGQRKG